MYLIISVLSLAAGLLLLFLPVRVIRKWSEAKRLPLILRLIGFVLAAVAAACLFAVLSGRLVLPLAK